MKKCHLICNLESGKGIKKKDIDTIINLIKSYDYDVTLHITEKSGDATSIVKKIKTCDLVLSIGGDGTFNEIVTGNYQRKDKLLLSHIPVGTTNDIGTMLGMNKNIVKSVKDILNGTVKQMDIGLINDQPFIYVAGFGKFINVPYETERKLKKSLGHLAYLINGFKEFFQITKLYDIEYEIDGVKERGLFSLILISNANHIAGFNNIYKNVKLDDDKFKIIFCNISRRKDLVRSLIMLVKNDITKIPGIYSYTGKNIKIKFYDKPKNNWTIDGEKYKNISKTYEIKIEKNMEFLLPKKNLDKLFTK